VLYAVVRNGVGKPSGELLLTVESLAESVLEAPRILQASDDLNLDIRTLTGDADLTVKPWPFIEAGQQISLRFEGTKADGTAYNWAHPTWQDLPIGSTGEPSTMVALSNLRELKDGSSLTLIFEVSFDGGITNVPFPVRLLSVIQGAYGFEGFEAETPRPIPYGTSQMLPSGLKVVSYNTGVNVTIARAGSQQDEHGFQYLSLTSSASGYAALQAMPPHRIYSTIRFTLWSTIGRGVRCHVQFVSLDNVVIHERHLDIPYEARVLVEYTTPPTERIYYFTIRPEVRGDEMACDSIYWSE